MTNSCGMFSAVFPGHPFAILRPERVRKIRQGATRFERARNWFSREDLLQHPLLAIVVVGMAIATHRQSHRQRPQRFRRCS